MPNLQEIPTQKGRERVGVRCKEDGFCRNSEICKQIYVEDLLDENGDCKIFLFNQVDKDIT